jgi:hypothetical protein
MAKRYQRAVLRRFADSDCPFGIFWPLYCLFFVDWLILIALLVSFGHCIICSASIYWFWLPLWYLMGIVLCVLRRFCDSDCPFGIFWPLYCVFFVDWLILIFDAEQIIQWPKDTKRAIRISQSTKNTQYNGQNIPHGQSESVNRRRTDNTMAKRYQRVYCLFFVDLLILIAPLGSFGHCIVCSSSIYWFWLPLWYLLAIVLCVLRRFTDSDYPSGIFWPLNCVF